MKKKQGRPTEFWTAENIKLLKKLYPVKDNEDVAEALGTTVRAIRSKAQVLKIKKSNRYWQKAWEDWVVKNYPILDFAELEVGLKKEFGVQKGKWAIINKYRELTGKR